MKKFIIKLLSAIAGLICAVPLFKRIYLLVVTERRPFVTVSKGQYKLRFSTPTFIPYWRAQTFFTKEPETLEWIDGFFPDDVLYDIGANVGVYTIYAAVTGKAKKVISFEPESQNYALLNENVFINNLADRVVCLNIALSNANRLDYLYLSRFSPGEAMHSFGAPVDFRRVEAPKTFKQGMISYSLDSFIKTYGAEFPNHLKIDVDGLEKEIIEGARKTLGDPRLKSVLIEINEELEEDMLMIEDLKTIGFDVKFRRHSSMFDTGEFSMVYNYVFEKRQRGVL